MNSRILPILSESPTKLVHNAGQVVFAHSLFPDEPINIKHQVDIPNSEAKYALEGLDTTADGCEREYSPSSSAKHLLKDGTKRLDAIQLAGCTLQTLIAMHAATNRTDINKAVWIVANKAHDIQGKSIQLHSRCRKILDAFNEFRNSAHLSAAWLMMSSEERELAKLAGSGLGGHELLWWLMAADWFLGKYEALNLREANNKKKPFHPWRVPSLFRSTKSFLTVPALSTEDVNILSQYTSAQFRGE